MHWTSALLIPIVLGGLVGRGLGFFMAEFYWHNDGKTRAITYFYFEGLGIAGGIAVGLVAMVFTLCTQRELEKGNGLSQSP